MSPLIGGDIPMDETDNELGLSTLPNGVINADIEGSDDDWSDEGEGEEENGEAPEYAGYQLLSQDNETQNADVADDPSESPQQAGVNLPSHLVGLLPSQVPQPDPSTSVSYRDNQEEHESRKQAMAEDEQIKTAMLGFTLPASSVPKWASSVAEEEWKRTLLMKMNEHSKQSDSQHKDQNTDR